MIWTGIIGRMIVGPRRVPYDVKMNADAYIA